MRRRASAARRGLVLAALLASRSALADGLDADFEALLDENVVTTASKSAQTDTVTPAVSTSITVEELHRYGIHSLDEAIDFLSLGLVTSNPLRDVEVGARGVLLTRDRGNHLLLLIDGHSMNEPLYGSAQFGRGTGVPLELVDHIEVVIGPGSVLYGSNAMLGVINIITKRAKDFAGSHLVFEDEIGKSYRAAVGAGYALPFLGRGSEITLELEYYRQDGPTFTFPYQYLGIDGTTGRGFRTRRNGPEDGVWGGEAGRSYYTRMPSGLVRFKSGDFELSLAGSSFKRSSPAAAFYSPYDGDFDDPENYEHDYRAWADARYTERLSPVARLTTRVYGDTFEYERVFTSSTSARCFYPDDAACLNRTNGVALWAGSEVQMSLNWLHDSRFVTLLGADGRILSVRAKSDVQNADTLAYRESSREVVRANERVLGTYVQQTWNPSPIFGLNGGARLDISGRYDPVVSPRVAGSIEPWKGGALKLIYGEAFRAPSWNETRAESPTLVAADDLKAERVRSTEAVIDQKLGAQRLLFGGFYSRWTNLIDLHRLTTDEAIRYAREGRISNSVTNYIFNQYRNLSEVDAWGFNARVEGALVEGRLRYALSGTAAVARQTDDTVGLSHPPSVAPRAFGNARVSYDFQRGLPVVALAAHYLSRRPGTQAFNGNFDEPPYAPAQLELRFTVSGPVPIVSGLSYRASVDYATSGKAAYVVGPVQERFYFPRENPELAPVDQFRATLGLRYDFLP